MRIRRQTWQTGLVALLAEGVGRNCVRILLYPSNPRSPSSRRAWVEITLTSHMAELVSVALLAEGVGRNQTWLKLSTMTHPVALLAEGVGRNTIPVN